MGEIQLSYVMVRQRGITWEKTPWERITEPDSNVPVFQHISSVLSQVWIALWHENTVVLVQTVELLGHALGFSATASRSQHVEPGRGRSLGLQPQLVRQFQLSRSYHAVLFLKQSFRMSAWARVINMIGIVCRARGSAAWCSDFQ